jgi:putative membrane protein
MRASHHHVLLSSLATSAVLVLSQGAAGAQSKCHKEALSDPVAWVPSVAAVTAPIAYAALDGPRIADEAGGSGERLTDSKILFVTHIANAGEVEMAKLARERAKDARVRKLAAAILAQHERADQKEEALIKRRKLDMSSTPTGVQLQSDGAQILAELETKSGTDFDRAYLAAQVDAHQRVLDLIDNRLLPAATDRDIQTLVRDMRPTVQSHLQRAQALQLKVKE